MNEIGKNYLNLPQGTKRAFWITLMLGVILSIFASQLFPELLSATTDLKTRIADAIPALLGLVAFISAGLFLSGKSEFSVWLVLLATILSLTIGVTLAEGYGFPAACIILVITIILPTQVLQGRRISLILLIGFTAAIFIIIIDNFLPSSITRIGIGSEDVRFANLLTVLLLIVVLIGIAIQYRQFPIRVKLMVAFIGLTAISVGLIAIQSITINSRYLTESIGNRISQEALSKSSDLGNELSRITNLLTITSYDDNFQQAIKSNAGNYSDERPITDQLADMNQQWKNAYESNRNDPIIYQRLTNPAATNLRIVSSRTRSLGDLFVTDRYGALVGSVKIFPQLDFSIETWWQTAFNNGDGSFFIGSPQYNENENRITILVAVPVIDRAGNYLIGILGTELPFEPLIKMLRSNLTLIGNNAGLDIIFPGNPPLKYSEFLDGSRLLVAVDNSIVNILSQENQPGFAQTSYEGVDSIVSFADVIDTNLSESISQLNWKVAVHSPSSDALEVIKKQQRGSIAILLVIGAVATAGALGLSQLISQPLQELSSAAQRLGQGDLDIRAKVSTGDEIGMLANEFNNMADQIKQILAGLEQQIADRTQAVTTSAEVSRRLSTILDQQQLLLSVVEEIKSAFNLYHAQIYLLDESNENLVMVGGTGEAGKTMMEQGHKIPLGRGLVGQAAKNNLVILVPETTSDPNWLPNPLLPDTKAEVAVPITIGDKVLGVLDIQHKTPYGLSDQTANLLQSIANQVAVAVQNARLFSQTRKQAEREAIILTINQKLQSETTIENVLETAAIELSKALSLNRASIEIDSKHSNFAGNGINKT